MTSKTKNLFLCAFFLRFATSWSRRKAKFECNILTEQRNCGIVYVILLQIYKNDKKIQIYVDIHVIEDILKTITQKGKEVVMHISHMKYGRKEGVIFSFANLVGGMFIAGI